MLKCSGEKSRVIDVMSSTLLLDGGHAGWPLVKELKDVIVGVDEAAIDLI